MSGWDLNEGTPVDIADLTLRPPSDADEVRRQLRAELGLPGGQGPRRPPDGPDVSGLAEGLGLK